MKLGIFAKTFVRDSLEANLDAVCQSGFQCTQYNLACAGLPTLPDAISPELCQRIRRAHHERDLTMASISGTFNIIDHDRESLEANFLRLQTLAQAHSLLGTNVITLCTGTRDRDSMWRRHPDNDTVEAWQEMVTSMRRIVSIAEECKVIVGVEPEVNNVVDSAEKARRLIDELGSPRVQVVMDAANLFHAGQLNRMHEVLDEAFDFVGQDIVIAHAKDLSQDGDAGHEAAGSGVLDYDYYITLLQQSGFDGPFITHGLSEQQVPQCIQFLQDKLAR